METICHSKCHCFKSMDLIQCSSMVVSDFGTFRAGMGWVKLGVFTKSVIDTEEMVKSLPNLVNLQLHECEIVKCTIKGCPVINTERDTAIGNSLGLKTSSKTDVTVALKTSLFEGFVSVLHMTTATTPVKEDTLVYYVLTAIICIIITVVIIFAVYTIRKYCCKRKRQARRPRVPPPAPQAESDVDNVSFDLFVNQRVMRSGRTYKKAD